jgi:hypothetical protein
MSDDEFDESDGDRCQRCGATERGLRGASIDVALAAASGCIDASGYIDRTHVEAVHALFGAFAIPLEPWLADRARALRPELARAAHLVAPHDVILVIPEESWSRRLEQLLELGAPDIVVEDARRALAREASRHVHLEWDRVRAWPASEHFLGTLGFGVIARTIARHVVSALAPDEADDVLATIDAVIAAHRLDADGFAARAELVTRLGRARTMGDVPSTVALRFAIRCIDELGHTGLRDDQDTLVDAAYFGLLHAKREAEARAVFAVWRDVAVPEARARVASVAFG